MTWKVFGNNLEYSLFKKDKRFTFIQIANIYSQIITFAVSFETKHGRDEFIDSQTRLIR